MNGTLVALIALVPAMTGPLPEEPRLLFARLCTADAGATIAIPLPPRRSPLTAPCHAKGCHGSSRRGEFDLAQ